MGEKENRRARWGDAPVFSCAHLFQAPATQAIRSSLDSLKKCFQHIRWVNRPWVPLRNSVEVADQFTPPENVASARRNLSFLHLFYILNILRSFFKTASMSVFWAAVSQVNP